MPLKLAPLSCQASTASAQMGEFRASQNWIGGTPPRHARFVQPPLNSVPDCMAALERFIHTEGGGIHPIIRATLTHLQFESIHPFFDGNGRSGRSLIVWQLCQENLIRSPLLSLSTYFQQHQSTYSSLLFHVRLTYFLMEMADRAEV